MIKGLAMRIYVLLTVLFLYVPIVVLMIMGFNESRYNSLPFKFSLKWYEELAENDTLMEATANSLILAFVTGIICVILATLFILGVKQRR